MYLASISFTWLSLWLGTLAHLLCVGLVAYHCLQTKREPAVAILWIFIAWSFPVIGPFAYLSLGVDRVARKGFDLIESDRRLRVACREREQEALPLAYWRTVHEAAVTAPVSDAGRQLNMAIGNLSPDHPLLGGNRLELLVSGDDWYPLLFESIREARHHIHIQSFIIRNDQTGRKIMQLFQAAAARGITVRVMYDRFGSTGAVISGFFRRYQGITNLHLQGWTQANPFKRQFQVNLRNHRKIAIIDGRLAFCGGINLSSDNYASQGKAAFRDYHFKVCGPAVQELQYSFIRDWHYMTGAAPDSLLTAAYFPHIEPAGQTPVRIINSGPYHEIELMTETFFLAITAASRQILLVTPYFIPPRELSAALRAAARRRVDVRVIVPRRNNHFYAGLASRALYGELLDSGVRIFERNPPFLHAKALVVDDFFSMVGSANLDMRSLRLNYETNLAVFDEEFTDRLKAVILDEQSHSTEVNPDTWHRRPAWRHCTENLFHLMAPVL